LMCLDSILLMQLKVVLTKNERWLSGLTASQICRSCSFSTWKWPWENPAIV
jgi:hypothetical protein